MGRGVRVRAARAVLVRAEGDNFSAGADVEMFLDRDEAAARELIEEFIPAIRRFAEIEGPTVVVNRVVPADDLREKARSFARRLASGPTLAHAATKRMIRLAVDEGVEAADAALPEVGARVMASDDLQCGARALLEKGPGHATFEGR